MDPIREGATGAAVEDIQERLGSLGYEIGAEERDARTFGTSTASAVAKFRIDHGMPLGAEIDSATWSELVDACYEMGDRTLYLRLPNLHGNDVRELQERLNILGFSCGDADGCFGVHTEAAVKQFQESQGMLADGMAFPDTYDAIDRLHHVWGGKPAAGPHPMGGMGFARAASVLENVQISLTAEDPISRNVAGRIWNLASATSDKSGLDLIETPEHPREGDTAVIVLSTQELPDGSKVANLTTDDIETLPQRLRTTCESTPNNKTPVIRLELPHGLGYDGTFTVGDAQTFAVMLLDAICSAFDF
ncbi:MAG: peptidoglycan-binding protein [Olsenella sp.]|nr:peptidoglycan-binding protein [Olsenella sp.]